MTDWLTQGAAALGRGIAAGRIDPRDLAEAFLAAIEAHPEAGRIYARTTPERARAEAAAAAARAKAGTRRGPLDGVPVSWKDLFDTAGTATEAGTPLMRGRVPERDAALLRRATAAGLVCLGKTHMTEIAFSGLGLNPMTATPPNALIDGAVPGGSSSGAAASVAFGLAPVAVGSDTGGSIRVPSVWNGLVGIKPTHGLLPLEGAVPLCDRFDTAGPLARSLADGAGFLASVGGPNPDLRGASLKGARLLVMETVVMEDVEPQVASAFDKALAALEAAGAVIHRAGFAPLERAYEMAGPLYTAEAWAWWRGRIEADPEAMYPPILSRVSAGRDVSAADWIAGWAELGVMRRDWAAMAAGYDAVICPGAALLPPQAAAVENDAELFRTANLKTLRNTRLANMMGLPSIALPAGGRACGILLNGAAGQDGQLMRLAAAAEPVLTETLP